MVAFASFRKRSPRPRQQRFPRAVYQWRRTWRLTRHRITHTHAHKITQAFVNEIVGADSIGSRAGCQAVPEIPRMRRPQRPDPHALELGLQQAGLRVCKCKQLCFSSSLHGVCVCVPEQCTQTSPLRLHAPGPNAGANAAEGGVFNGQGF